MKHNVLKSLNIQTVICIPYEEDGECYSYSTLP